MYVYGNTNARVCVGQKTTCRRRQYLVFSWYHLGPGIELGSSGLVLRAFTF